MSSDYTAIHKLLEEAEKHKEQMQIHKEQYDALIKTVQEKCAHPATVTQRTSQEDDYGRIKFGQDIITYKCMVCNKCWENGYATK